MNTDNSPFVIAEFRSNIAKGEDVSSKLIIALIFSSASISNIIYSNIESPSFQKSLW